MKKILSLVMAIVLILPSALPLRVSAAEQETMSYDQLITVAKATFPEYASKIDGIHSRKGPETQTINSEIYTAIQESRTVDNRTTMTYSEFSNGIVALSILRIHPEDPDLTIDDSVTYSNYEQFTATITAAITEGPVFTASNVKYRMYPSAYDRIVSAGSYGIPGYNSRLIQVSTRSVETASLPAGIWYEMPISVANDPYTWEVNFTIQNNRTSLVSQIRE